MPSIEFVDSTDELCESLQNFNQKAREHVEVVRAMIRQTKYWIYDSTSADYCPALFAAFKQMDFAKYDYCKRNQERKPIHGKFDGSKAAKVVARVCGKPFEANQQLGHSLKKWARRVADESAFGNANAGKWVFVSIQLPNTSLVRLNDKLKSRDLKPRPAGLEQELDDIEAKLGEEGCFDFSSVEDERERRLREIVQRRGRTRFRKKVLAAYDGKCAITQCDAVDALEAAHIRPYIGPDTDYTANGLLLRGDLHALFDLDLLGIDPSSCSVKLATRLLHSSYGSLDGLTIFKPKQPSNRPDKSALEWRWEQFMVRENLDNAGRGL